jgi:hypothetical protein
MTSALTVTAPQPEPGGQIREGARRVGWSIGLEGVDGERLGGGGRTPRVFN